MKSCTKCLIVKSLNEFNKDIRKTNGITSRCKLCTREDRRLRYPLFKNKILEWNKKSDLKNKEKRQASSRRAYLKRKFNISLEEYESMVILQNNKCKICSTQCRLFVDHDHSTGKIRGLLCQKCNILLGHANDNITILESAIQYLRG